MGELQIKELKEEYKEKFEKNKIFDQMKNNSNNNNVSSSSIQLKQHLEYLRSISNSLQSELTSYHLHSSSSSSSNKLKHLEQQKQQINNTIDNLYDLSLSLSSSTSNNNNNNSYIIEQQQYENKINKQNQQITKLKQQKKEMVKLVNDKLRDLKFIHQQELQKERQIANVLVTNHQKQIETLKERQQMMQPNNNNYQLVQMQQEMDQLKKLYQQSLMENESLKKIKEEIGKNCGQIIFKHCTNCK